MRAKPVPRGSHVEVMERFFASVGLFSHQQLTKRWHLQRAQPDSRCESWSQQQDHPRPIPGHERKLFLVPARNGLISQQRNVAIHRTLYPIQSIQECLSRLGNCNGSLCSILRIRVHVSQGRTSLDKRVHGNQNSDLGIALVTFAAYFRYEYMFPDGHH